MIDLAAKRVDVEAVDGSLALVVVAQTTQEVHAKRSCHGSRRLGTQDELAERDDLHEVTHRLQGIDLVDGQAAFRADDERHVAVDVASLERIADGIRLAVIALVGLDRKSVV